MASASARGAAPPAARRRQTRAAPRAGRAARSAARRRAAARGSSAPPRPSPATAPIPIQLLGSVSAANVSPANSPTTSASVSACARSKSSAPPAAAAPESAQRTRCCEHHSQRAGCSAGGSASSAAPAGAHTASVASVSVSLPRACLHAARAASARMPAFAAAPLAHETECTTHGRAAVPPSRPGLAVGSSATCARSCGTALRHDSYSLPAPAHRRSASARKARVGAVLRRWRTAVSRKSGTAAPANPAM